MFHFTDQLNYEKSLEKILMKVDNLRSKNPIKYLVFKMYQQQFSNYLHLIHNFVYN